MLTNLPPWAKTWFLDPFERAGSTFIQQLATILLVGTGAGLLTAQPWAVAADTAGWAAAITLVTTYVATLTGVSVTGLFDIIRRVGLTFLQSLLGTMLASSTTSFVHASWSGAASVALIAALTAALKAIAAQSLPTVGSSLLVPASTTPDGAHLITHVGKPASYTPTPADFEYAASDDAPDPAGLPDIDLSKLNLSSVE